MLSVVRASLLAVGVLVLISQARAEDYGPSDTDRLYPPAPLTSKLVAMRC
jgi:hypothetical protein